MNYNISVRNNQAFSKNYISLIYWMGGNVVGYDNYKPLSIKYEFTQIRKKILSVLLRYTGVYHEIYVSQDRIADLSGCHHDTVLRTLKLFVELGLIKKKYRGANRTCIYSLGSFFHYERVQWALKDILPNLYWSIKSTVRRCKSLLKGLAMSIYKPITARLSNDKNKDIKKHIKKDIQYIKPEPIIAKLYEPDPDHDKFFNEFAAILNISP